MADKKITQLTQHTSVINSDLLPVVDITATETKKLTVGTLRDFINTGLVSSTNTGSFYISSSVVDDTITFTQGDGTTEQVIVDNVNSASYATNADTATNSDNVGVVIDNTTGTKYVPFVDVSSGYDNLKVDTGLVYSAFSNTLTVGGAVTAPAFNGLATNATNVNVGTTSLNTNYYVSFAYGAGNNRVEIDGGGQFTYNPSTNTLTVPTVTATTALTAPLQNGYMWVGNGSNVNQQIPTSSFVTPAQTGSFVESAYISLYSSASQVLVASGSAQPVTFTSVWANQGITLESGSRLVMAEPGVYQFNFVAQVGNSDNAVHDSWFWIKYNGSNFPNSTTEMTLQPRKSSGEPSAQLMTMNIVGVNQVANGYIELYWTGDSTTTQLKETPAFGPVPETPSIIADIIRVG